MTEEEPRGIRIALMAIAAVVVVIMVLLASNIIWHALHRTTSTAVKVTVEEVTAIDASTVEIRAILRSETPGTSDVSCLVGVERPATPLAFPIRVSERLDTGVAKQIIVRRSLIKPLASQVTTSDVALTCT
jgi:hypothetical protein